MYNQRISPGHYIGLLLDIENAETDKDKMVINESKYNIITFNLSSRNIGPQNLILNRNRIDQVDKIKLLGVVITDFLC